MATHILTDITHQFQLATATWHSYLFPIANHMFIVLATIEIAWAAIWWSMDKDGHDSIFIELLKKIVTISIFYSILLYSPMWMPAIVNSFIKIGAHASGKSMLYPSDIMDQGISLAGNIYAVFRTMGIFSFGMGTLVGCFAGFIVILSFAMIAGLLVVTLVESYIVLGAGVLLLGFGSSRLSTKFASNYVSYAVSVGTKLFMLYLVIGVGGSLANGWIEQFVSLKSTDINIFLEIAGGSLVFLFCAWAVPHKAESLISGASNATLGGLIASTAVARTAASAVGAVASGAMSAGSSAIEAVKQAKAIAGSEGGSLLKGAAVAGFNLAGSTVGGLSGYYSNASQGMKAKTKDIKESLNELAEQNAATKGGRPAQTSPPASTSSPTPVA